MTYEDIHALRAAIVATERSSAEHASLFRYEEEYLSAPDGISVIVPVHNGVDEMDELFLSLRNQSLDPSKFEVIFCLNGCTDDSRARVDTFVAQTTIDAIVLESPIANVAHARNDGLQQARFRHATFVDHDDHISRGFLTECVALADYRSVVVSNIIKFENGELVSDYAQGVVLAGFNTSHIHAPQDIALCYRAYTLNAIKTAPTYMMRRISYDEILTHSEDMKYWRDLFHAFTPITVKSPTRRDIYYRKVLGQSLSRRSVDFYDKAKPRFTIMDQIDRDAISLSCDAPQRKFDVQLRALLVQTLLNLGRN